MLFYYSCFILLVFYSIQSEANYFFNRLEYSIEDSNFGNTNVNRTKIVWMLPTWNCRNENAINVEKYGILQNSGQKFQGGPIFAIFYESKFGKVPYFAEQDVNKPINGGLPQVADLKAHFYEAQKNIEEMIPDPNFDGIAVIDIEEIRPNWELSWGKFKIYKSESMKLVREKHPTWSIEKIEKQAKKDYNWACKKLFLGTLKLAKSLRPNAKWGYYLFPKCNNNVIPSNYCNKKFQIYNENIKWLWKHSTALFPSIYLYDKNMDTVEANYYNVKALLRETQRVQKMHCPKCEIHVFTKIEYGNFIYPQDFYSKQNLDVTMGLVMNLNLNSGVIWSTSVNMTNRCAPIGEYLNATLGPYLDSRNKWLSKCAQQKCSSNGECYLRVAKRFPQFSDFQCKCDSGYSGAKCDIGYKELFY